MITLTIVTISGFYCIYMNKRTVNRTKKKTIHLPVIRRTATESAKEWHLDSWEKRLMPKLCELRVNILRLFSDRVVVKTTLQSLREISVCQEVAKFCLFTLFQRNFYRSFFSQNDLKLMDNYYTFESLVTLLKSCNTFKWLRYFSVLWRFSKSNDT